MAKKSGLGRGLEALFTDNVTESGITSLRLSEIEPNKGQPRKEFDEEALTELADSIAQHGIIQPLLVRPILDGGYQLVAGERRWRAARRAGLTEVPVVIRDMTDQEMMELALIENLQREDLNPLEEAEGYKQLMDSYGLTQDEVSRVVGKGRTTVTNSLRLLHLPEPCLNLLRDGKLSAGHGRTLLAFKEPEEMVKAANTVVDQDLSVRALERMTQRTGRPKTEYIKPKKARRDKFFDEVELALQQELGRKVKVLGVSKRGTLEIEFYSHQDLADIANRLAATPGGFR